MELSGHKKTPVPNRGFVPGLPRSYNPFGLETANIQQFIGNCIAIVRNSIKFSKMSINTNQSHKEKGLFNSPERTYFSP